MRHSLVGVLALVGILAACSGATSPDGSNSRSRAGSDSTAPTDSDSTAPGKYAVCNAPPPSDLFPPPDPTQPRAILWFLDGAVRRGPVNLCIDSWRGYKDWPKISAYGGLFMRSSSIPHTLMVTAASDSTVLASTTMTFAVDTQYTVVFTPRSNLLVLFDTASAPPLGKESIRIVNIASDAVDVYVTTGPGMPGGSDTLPHLTPVLSNLAPDAVSPYLSYPAVPTRIIITAAGDPNTVLHETGTGDATAAGKVWTVFFGEMDADNTLQLTTLWQQDRD